jgi:hypothetical protein
MPSRKKAAAESAAPPEEDVSMEEAPADNLEGEDGNPVILASDEQRIRIVSL